MHDSLENIINKAKELPLDGQKKQQIRKDLEVFMRAHPAYGIKRAGLYGQKFSMPVLWSFSKKPLSIGLIAALLCGGTLSYAAEGSLPGDYLYTVKTAVNETVRGSLQFSAGAKARWDMHLAERRLEEAEKLASEGEVRAEQRAIIENNFAEHASRIEARIKKFEEKDDLGEAAEVATNFETSLRAHGKILERLAEEHKGKDFNTEVGTLMEELRSRNTSMSQARLKLESRISEGSYETVKKSAEEKKEAALRKIEEVREHIGKTGSDADAETRSEAEKRLTTAEEAIAGGEAEFTAGSFGNAFALFQQAQQIAQEAKLILNARRTLKLNIRFNGKDKTHDDKAEDNEETDDKENPDTEDHSAKDN